jgi:hypothetical protein
MKNELVFKCSKTAEESQLGRTQITIERGIDFDKYGEEIGYSKKNPVYVYMEQGDKADIAMYLSKSNVVKLRDYLTEIIKENS